MNINFQFINLADIDPDFCSMPAVAITVTGTQDADIINKFMYQFENYAQYAQNITPEDDALHIQAVWFKP